MLLTANQPTPATTVLMPAGRMLPRKPKPVRLITICGTPCFGPQLDSTPWLPAPHGRAEDDREERLPERQAEGQRPDDADADGCELHVRRRPCPQQLQRRAVPLVERDEVDAARLDRDDPVAVVAVGIGDDRNGGAHGRHCAQVLCPARYAGRRRGRDRLLARPRAGQVPCSAARWSGSGGGASLVRGRDNIVHSARAHACATHPVRRRSTEYRRALAENNGRLPLPDQRAGVLTEGPR